MNSHPFLAAFLAQLLVTAIFAGALTLAFHWPFFQVFVVTFLFVWLVLSLRSRA